jgi:phosphotriesterase-related protein
MGTVQTVLGQVDPQALGVTSTHEHLLLDLACYFEMPDEATERAWVDFPVTMDRLPGYPQRFTGNRPNTQLFDEQEATEEIAKYAHAGGGALVDTTNSGIGRDPLALARIARATGLHIVMGSGYYVPVAYPLGLDERSEADIAAEIVRDITVGVGDTGVRAGLIGEVGNFWPTNETSEKVLRASAAASVQTGAAISIHPGFHPDSAPAIVETLVGAGADPDRIIMGHLDMLAVDRGWLRELAQSGCYLEWDVFGVENTGIGGGNLDHMRVATDAERIDLVAFMFDEGFGDRVVAGHDVCTRTQRTRYGGKGYAHLLESVVARMKQRGHSQADIDAVLIKNPARALAHR